MRRSLFFAGATFVAGTVVGGVASPVHAAALVPSCRVLAAGRNIAGQLGDGTNTDRSTPVGFLLPANESARTVELATVEGARNVSVLTYSGRVFSAGLNTHGQLGDGTTVDRSTPVSFALPAGEVATHIVAAGNTTYVVTSAGRVFGAGRNHKGQLGDGTTASRSLPVQMQLPAGTRAVRVIPGAETAYVVLDTGQLAAVGGNQAGQLGQGNALDAAIPVIIPLPAGEAAVDAVESRGSTYVQTASGRVFGAGSNTFGQLGDGTTLNATAPVEFRLPAGEIATSLHPGSDSMYVRTGSGKLFAAGYNAAGQLGNGTTAPTPTPVQFALPATETLASVVVAVDRIYVITAAGRVFGAGANQIGQLGIGSVADAATPTPMLLPAGVQAVEVKPTLDAVFIRTASGEVFAVGGNEFGYLGDGDNLNRSTPVRWGLPTTEKAVEISPAFGYVFVRTASGETFGAGWNSAGNLGDGTYENRSSPVRRVNPAGSRIVSNRSILSKHSFSYSISCVRSGTLRVTTRSVGSAVRPAVWSLSVASANCGVEPLADTVPGTDGSVDFSNLPVYVSGTSTPCLYSLLEAAEPFWDVMYSDDAYALIDDAIVDAIVDNVSVSIPPTVPNTGGPGTTAPVTNVSPVIPTSRGPAVVSLPETGTSSSRSATVAAMFVVIGVAALGMARRRPVLRESRRR